VILSGEEIARVADLFGQKFPDLSPGATMSISFFRIKPAELGYIDNTKEGADAPEGTFGAEFHRERSYSVFDALPMELSESVAAELQTVKADAGEMVVRQGGPADKFFIVVEGEVEVSRDADGGETAVATFGPGQFFGEMAIIRDAPRSASVKATQPTTLLAMERDTFRDIVAQALGTTGSFDEIIRSRLAAQSPA
jgi:hypothetical protein